MRYICCFFLIIFTAFSVELKEDLDMKNISISDFLVYLSKNSDYTIVGDNYVSNLKIDCYFKKGTSVEKVIEILQKTYNISKEKRGNIVILREKNQRGEILVGRVIDKKNRKPISGIEIVLKGDEEFNKKTGEFGEFIIDNMKIGAYFLTVKSKDFFYEGEFIETKKGVNIYNIMVDRKRNEKNQNIIVENKQKNQKNDIIEHIYLENSNYNEIEKVLNQTFKDNLRVSVSPGSNGIVVSGEDGYVKKAMYLISKMDKKQKQIRVTAEILDVKENLFEELGITWAFDSRKQLEKEEKGLSLGILTDSSLGEIGKVLGSNFTFVGKFNSSSDILKTSLKMLEASQDLKTKALPSIILLNGEEGNFKMVEEVIVGEDKKEDNGNDTINYEPIFKEAGIILKVTPLVKKDNSIYLTISLEASDFKLKKSMTNIEENSGTFNSQGGSKVSRALKTRVRLNNNETILIGGLKRKIEQKISNKLPILGDIPILGNLFKSKGSSVENTDLYIKLKAEIID